ncbi:helix-turn-helix domain-containing protein [Dinghuibacter silviterrae]|uniref:AraC-like DNA-binding protein n=1 Tax=Dinghuibacter silviterrae TaxID=1539049 RepID=A0A4R8DVN2_9BACT|nr:helix-turn-helix transcriptional regulator [Dinghuibacter silviterrae]TDX01535.1 AraC-like DNA-binding protein [Dinghuibacter silviterrae]
MASLTLTDPRTKQVALKVTPFTDDSLFNSLKKYNCFSMLLVSKGRGTVQRDETQYAFNSGCLLSFAIYQPFMVKPADAVEGVLVNFHPSFFCLFKHRQEVSCNGVLFNNLYDTPVAELTPGDLRSLSVIVDQISSEMQRRQQPDQDVLLSYLKVFLMEASRAKIEQREGAQPVKAPLTLENLRTAIETHYKTLHSPGDYGDLLHISTKALNKACKAHFDKTLTDLIAERLIIEAKRELYLTAKSVKEIAFELGYEDEFYFSRYFKKKVGVSPQIFRDTVGFDKLTA